MSLLSFLELPETRGLDIDSPKAIPIHRDIILRKEFLRRLYLDHYQLFKDQAKILAPLKGEMLELGSGGGFLKEVMPEVITSDVEAYPTVDRVALASPLPFADASLKAIFLLNVLHHIPEPELFFKEAQRCLVPGGRIVMIEPFNSIMARFLYKNFHHEPFDETVTEWHLPKGGRLSMSNQAMPWIIFSRDRALFEKRYPSLRIVSMEAHTFLGYALSGGLSWRSLLPGAAYPIIRGLDGLLSKLPSLFPIFQSIILERK